MTRTMHTDATPGTLCGWTERAHRTLTCGSAHGGPGQAVHIMLVDLPIAPAGTALCRSHTPFSY